MDTSNIEEDDDDDVSDDEIFFGKITIKEIKKRFCIGQGPSKPYDVCKRDNPSSGISHNKTHSEPNIRLSTANSPGFVYPASSPALGSDSDASFIEIENIVSKLSSSPRNAENVDLNDTSEIIDHIRNHRRNRSNPSSGISHNKTHSEPNIRLSTANSPGFVYPASSPALGSDSDASFIEIENIVSKLFSSPRNAENVDLNDTSEIIDLFRNHRRNRSNIQAPCVIKHDKQEMDMASLNVHSSLKVNPVKEMPIMINQTLKPSTSRLTPSTSRLTPSTSRLTPNKYAANAYKYISSPVLHYIMNTPKAPLVKAVHPKRPLPKLSTPKLVRNSSQSKEQINENKENTYLPSIAYKCAKKTNVVQLPDENRFPQSQRIKKRTSSIPRPIVKKHRE